MPLKATKLLHLCSEFKDQKLVSKRYRWQRLNDDRVNG